MSEQKAFDFKKEYKDLYIPKAKPILVEIPAMNFIMIDGAGDPNRNQEFQQAVEVLYGLSYAIKMSSKKGRQPEGFFEYVVPPLEGLWWIDSGEFSFDIRDNWMWTLMIRQPEFVTTEVFEWARNELKRKKPEIPMDKAGFGEFHEGLCVQVMHIGPYATEPETINLLKAFVKTEELEDKVGNGGKHHEIYLSDPRKSSPETMKTVLRHPVVKASI